MNVVSEEVVEYDSSETELQSIACEVFARIPADAQGHIESKCDRVTFTMDGDSEAEFFPAEREICVVVTRISDYSDSGKRGIFAHEFGHAYAQSQGQVTPGATHEKLANVYAQGWGFLAEIDAMKAESARFRGAQ